MYISSYSEWTLQRKWTHLHKHIYGFAQTEMYLILVLSISQGKIRPCYASSVENRLWPEQPCAGGGRWASWLPGSLCPRSSLHPCLGALNPDSCSRCTSMAGGSGRTCSSSFTLEIQLKAVFSYQHLQSSASGSYYLIGLAYKNLCHVFINATYNLSSFLAATGLFLFL